MTPSESENPKADAQASPTPPAEAPKKPDEAGKPTDARYVFKILPANPKNAFDFEDVADK